MLSRFSSLPVSSADKPEYTSGPEQKGNPSAHGLFVEPDSRLLSLSSNCASNPSEIRGAESCRGRKQEVALAVRGPVNPGLKKEASATVCGSVRGYWLSLDRPL